LLITLLDLLFCFFALQLDIVEILNDAMYSDSPEVVDALADFMDRAMGEFIETTTTNMTKQEQEHKMNQVRHIINVSESTFNASFSPDQLRIIEQKEMVSILEQLVCSVGLQRVRFQERQNQGRCTEHVRAGRKGAGFFCLFFV
jgi:hypothetical protein